ncbi:flavodoxin domain-containing protein [Paracoccus luteus]|uniref:flavodoxin domain-containing protein n=1 Tax=Paracoccus luteus TaxID=2508543 RepID=UPI001FE7BC3A|nr:flavodoxin domain-containing protein [Paracoccus luteus]
MMNIVILYGTETGNAEMLAEDIQSGLQADHQVEILNLSDFAPGDFDRGRLYLIVSSTYGDGELPASAQPFGQAMKAQTPDLTGVVFGLFGLGDSEYDTFNLGSKVVQDLMEEAGATMLGERIVHDASGSDMAEDLALPWAREVVSLAETRIGVAA